MHPSLLALQALQSLIISSQAHRAVDLLHSVDSGEIAKLPLFLETLLSLCHYRTSVHKLEVTGTYNRYEHGTVSINLYGNYDPRKPLFTLDLFFGAVKRYIPSSNHFQLVVAALRASHHLGPTSVVGRLTSFFEFLEALVDETETQLIEFLNRNFNGELKQLANLQLMLEELNIFLDNSAINEIANYMGIPQNSHNYTYQGFQATVGLASSDSNFKNLFYLMLQVSSVRFSPSHVDHDFSEFIKLMLDIFRLSCDVEWMELCTFDKLEGKLDALSKLVQGDGAVKTAWDDLLNKVKFYPETSGDPIPQVFGGASQVPMVPYPHVSVASSHRLVTEEDERELLNNIYRLFPILNQFNFSFDPLFVSSFQLFIHSLNVNSDLASESDYDYLKSFINLMNRIVDFEDDEADNDGDEIYGTALNLYNLHLQLSVEHADEVSESSMLMRYCIFKIKQKTSIVLRVIRKWNLKTLSISQLEYTLGHSWLPYSNYNLIKKTFDTWSNKNKRMERMGLASSNYYQKFLQAKYLFSEWIPKLKQINSLQETEKRLKLKKQFGKWHNKAKITQAHYINAISKHDRRMLSLAFSSMKSKHSSLMKLEKAAQKFKDNSSRSHNLLIILSIFQLWFNKIDSSNGDHVQKLSEKLRKLSLTENNFLLKKYLAVLMSASNLRRKESYVISNNDKFLMRFFFNKLVHLYKLNHLSNSFISQKDRNFKVNAFSNWKFQTRMIRIAQEFQGKRILKDKFKLWRLKMIADNFASNTLKFSGFTDDQLKAYFKKWKLSYKCEGFKKEYDFRLVDITFQRWISRKQMTREMVGASLLFEQRSLMNKSMNLWKSISAFHANLPEIADQFYLNKHWRLLLAKVELYRDKMLALENKHKLKYPVRRNISLLDQILAVSILNLWKQRKESRFEQESEWKINNFQTKRLLPSRKRHFFIHWVTQYNKSQARNKQLYATYKYSHINSGAVKVLFKRWKEQTIKRHQDMATSQVFHDRLLHKKYMVIWYDKFLNKGVYLEEIGQEYRDQIELKIQRDVLSEWSMKYIKFITRHQQSCDLFVRRWESARLKSIFDLWLYKYQNHIDIQSPIKEEKPTNVFLDTSMDSVSFNESPLALKSKKNNEEVGPNDTYLTSPIKSLTTVPYTPQGNNNISPSRMQTSLRMKNERLQALKERYSKARGSVKTLPTTANTLPDRPAVRHSQTVPSVKPYSFLNSKTKLSPPKRPEFSSSLASSNDSTLYLESVSRPTYSSTPRRDRASPVLKDEDREEDYDTTSSRDISPSKVRPRMSRVASEKDIEEAKRLRKITPIIIPFSSEDESEPRISPARTLKQRHSVTYSN